MIGLRGLGENLSSRLFLSPNATIAAAADSLNGLEANMVWDCTAFLFIHGNTLLLAHGSHHTYGEVTTRIKRTPVSACLSVGHYCVLVNSLQDD